MLRKAKMFGRLAIVLTCIPLSSSPLWAQQGGGGGGAVGNFDTSGFGFGNSGVGSVSQLGNFGSTTGSATGSTGATGGGVSGISSFGANLGSSFDAGFGATSFANDAAASLIGTAALGRSFGGGFGTGFGRNNQQGFNFQNQNNNQQETTIRAKVSLGFTYVPPSAAVRTERINDLMSRMRLPTAYENVNVVMQGRTAIMRGNVATESEARFVMQLLSLEPGVDEVQNELVLTEQLPATPAVLPLDNAVDRIPPPRP